MAHRLYRLAKLAARRRWVFLIAWVLILGVLIGSAGAFMGKLTNQFSIPGTETQQTLDKVEDEFPDLAGGTGTVVFTTKDGEPFTDEQQKSVTKVLDGLEKDKTVVSAVDPFDSQKQLDDAPKKTRDAQKKLDDNKKKLSDGQKQIDDARKQAEDGQKQLDSGKDQLSEGLKKAEDGLKQMEAAGMTSGPQYEKAKTTQEGLKKKEAELEKNQQEIDAGKKKLDEKQKEIDEGKKKLADGEKELAEGKRQAESSEGLKFVSGDKTAAVSNLQFEGQAEAMESDERDHLLNELHKPEDTGVEVYPSQEISSDLNNIFGVAEAIGLVVAGLVLVVMMGTFVGAGLPLLQAILGVGAGVAGTLAFSSVLDMASITPALALMLGLAVGIDYTLFIIHRHRRQMLEGMETHESIGLALGTSGNAVVFAGLTVVIALAALVVPGLPFLSILGISAAVTVALAVLIAITLTPALLGFIGRRLVSKRAQRKHDARVARHQARAEAAGVSDHKDHRNHTGWAKFTTSKPWLAAIASIVVLGVIAIPAAKLTTALPDGAQEQYGSDAQVSYEITADRFGAGFNGPMIALVTLPGDQSKDDAEKTMYDVASEVRDVKGVTAASPVDQSDDNRYGMLQIVPSTGPASQDTVDLVHALRDLEPDLKKQTDAELSVTGQVTAQIDVTEKMSDALPPYLVIVVGLSLVLLLLVFRSIVVPVIATAGFLLSLAAAFGATVAVYQWGWLGSLFDVHVTGPIMAFLPILLTGILFGLAMDYQMFLVTAMREAYAHGARPRAAVRMGMKSAGPVVIAAALIMISVFAGFIFSELTMIRSIGFALAFGVLFDAFVVRLTITPAVMSLLGKHAWYLPRWLKKILPNVDVEGEALERELEAAGVVPGHDEEDADAGADGGTGAGAEAGAGGASDTDASSDVGAHGSGGGKHAAEGKHVAEGGKHAAE